jgi:hypothetical protein
LECEFDGKLVEEPWTLGGGKVNGLLEGLRVLGFELKVGRNPHVVLHFECQLKRGLAALHHGVHASGSKRYDGDLSYLACIILIKDDLTPFLRVPVPSLPT